MTTKHTRGRTIGPGTQAISAAEGALKTVSVRLADIVLDPTIQVRQALSQPTIRRYADAMRAGQVFPPIKAANVEGACFLVGGWHRVEAARLVGIVSLEAELIDAPRQHLAWLAAEDNLRHGLPLNRGREARTIFRAYVGARRHRTADGGYKSSRQIAQDLHGMKTHQTIINWMRSDFPSVYRAMTGAGEEVETSPGTGPDTDPLAPAREHLQQVIALARGITNPDRRGELIALLEDVRRGVERAGKWNPYDPPF